MYSPKVCKYKCITFPFEFHNFLQFLLDIKVSQIHDFVYNIGFMTLARTNSPQMQRKKSYHTFSITAGNWSLNASQNLYHKVNSVQEACAKCFVVHIFKFEILQITLKKLNKEHQTLSFQFFTNKVHILIFFHVVCKISNSNK